MKRRFFNKLLAAIPFFATASFAKSIQANETQVFGYEKRGIWEYYNLDEYQFSDNSSLHTPKVKEGSIISVFKNNVKIPLMQHYDIDNVREDMENYVELKQYAKQYIWVQSKNKHGFIILYENHSSFTKTFCN